MAEALQAKLQKMGAWDHLARTLLQVIRDNPSNPLEVFETLSQGAQGKIPVSLDEKETKMAVTALQAGQDKHYKEPVATVDENGETKEPEPEEAPDAVPHMVDLMKISGIISEAGVNFGEEETYGLSQAIKEFALNEGKSFKSIRLFGKILGSKKPYYILECSKEEWDPPAEDAAPLPEPMGQGTNEFQYWVTNSVASGSWTALPPVTPQQLSVAKEVRRFFTGDLEAEVKGYPYFPWKEAGYLRAQIAHITHSTIVSPVGVWQKDDEAAEEDKDAIKLAENYQIPKASNLLSLDSWNHHRRYIIPELGVCKPPASDDDEGKAKPQYDQEYILTPIGKSKRGGGKWRVSLCTPFGVRPALYEHAVVSAQSLAFPGAYCVAKGSTVFNIYVGTGHAKLACKYSRPKPPVPQEEFKLPDEQEDPPAPVAEEAKKEEEKKDA